MTRPAPPRFTCRVVGLTFVEGYPDNLHRLKAAWLAGGRHPVAVELTRQPDNPADRNAVVCAVYGIGPVGHLPRFMAERIAPDLDNGRRCRAWVADIIEHPDGPGNPGLEITVEAA